MFAKIPPHRRRWFIVAIIFIAILFNYVDRQIVSILKVELKAAFNMGDEGYAMILNVFMVCYAIMYPVTGWLVDKVGPRLVMFWGVLAWSVACIGGGLSRGVGMFGFFRGVLGLAEPTNFPSQLKVVTVWFPGRLRATANSLCVAGSSIGAIIAPPVVAWLALTYDWHMAFIIPGFIGVFIAIAWWLIYRDPPPEMAREAVESAGTSATGAFKWGQLWKTQSLWGILLIRFVSDPVWYFCLFWLPGYLREESGLSLAQVGMFAWIPFLCADLGGIGTSAWSDSLVRRGIQPLRARKIMLSTVAIVAPLCALTTYLPGAAATIIVFSLVAAMCISWLFTISVVVAESFPAHNVASVLGIAGGCGAVGGMAFNYFVGKYMQSVDASTIFLVMAFLHPIAVLILWTMVRPEMPPDSFEDNQGSQVATA